MDKVDFVNSFAWLYVSVLVAASVGFLSWIAGGHR